MKYYVFFFIKNKDFGLHTYVCQSIYMTTDDVKFFIGQSVDYKNRVKHDCWIICMWCCCITHSIWAIPIYTAGTEDDDYDDDDEKDLKLMPPPSFVPKGIKSGDGKLEKSSPQSSPDKSKANTPLAAMLPPELSNIDVAALFPEFRHGQVSEENNIDLVISNLHR